MGGCLRQVWLYSGFRLPLGPLLCFITLFLIICSSMWCFTDAARFWWRHFMKGVFTDHCRSHYEHSNFSVNPLIARFYERSVYWPLHHTMNTPISVLTHFSPETPKRAIGKQYRSRSDAAECGVWSGSTLIALNTGFFIKQGIQRTNSPVAHLRLFVLSKLMVTFLKN